MFPTSARVIGGLLNLRTAAAVSNCGARSLQWPHLE